MKLMDSFTGGWSFISEHAGGCRESVADAWGPAGIKVPTVQVGEASGSDGYSMSCHYSDLS